MFAPYILLAALILYAFPTSTRERGAMWMRGVTLVERLRSELPSVLHNEALAAEDATLSASRLDPALEPAKDGWVISDGSSFEVSWATRVIESAVELRDPRPTYRASSRCWLLWFPFGRELCE